MQQLGQRNLVSLLWYLKQSQQFGKRAVILLLVVKIQAGPELSPWISENNRKHENLSGEREETRSLYDRSQEKVKRDSIWSQETKKPPTHEKNFSLV